MIQTWNLRSRAHKCAATERHFDEGEAFFTAIYFDKKSGDYTRRDVCLDAWAEDSKAHPPFSYWRNTYAKPTGNERAEVTPKEGAYAMLQRMVEEGEPSTERARYILGLMLERKRILSPTAVKETEHGRLLMYENKKTGEAFVFVDPELRLDEIESLQTVVATTLGFRA